MFGTTFSWYSHFWADCRGPNTCHGSSMPGSCSAYHYGCGLAANELVESIQRALASTDADEVRKLAMGFPTRVQLLADGATLRVFDCEGGAVGELAFSRPSAV